MENAPTIDRIGAMNTTKIPPLPEFARTGRKTVLFGEAVTSLCDTIERIGASSDGKPIFSVTNWCGGSVGWAAQKRAYAWRNAMEAALDCVIFFR